MAVGTINTLTDVASIATIVTSKVLNYVPNYTVLSSLVTQDFSQDVATRGQTVLIPVLGELTVQDKTPNVAIDMIQPTGESSVSVVMNIEAYVDWGIEDLLRAVATPNLLEAYAKQSAMKLVERVESALAALWSDFTNSNGNAGVNVTPDVIRNARKLLSDSKVPPGLFQEANGVNFIVSTKDAESIRGDQTLSQAFSTGEMQNPSTVRTGILGRYSGMTFYESQLMETSTANGVTTTHNMCFGREALALVSRALPKPLEGTGVISSYIQQPLNPSTGEQTTTSGVTFQLVIGYDMANKAHRVSLGALFGVKKLRPSFGVHVKS